MQLRRLTDFLLERQLLEVQLELVQGLPPQPPAVRERITQCQGKLVQLEGEIRNRAEQLGEEARRDFAILQLRLATFSGRRRGADTGYRGLERRTVQRRHSDRHSLG
jgi:hypothetical protein